MIWRMIAAHNALETQVEQLTVWLRRPVGEALLIGLAVLAACLFGISTRLIFSLASLWPANAVLLAFLMIRPRSNRVETWIAATAAYLVAGVIAGDSFGISIGLTCCNLIGAAVGAGALKLTGRQVLSQNRPIDSIYVTLVLVAASAGAALGGTVVGQLYFGLSPGESIHLWFTVEFANYILVVPICIAFAARGTDGLRIFSRSSNVAWRQVLALGALAATILMMHFQGGPGAIAFTLPPMIWCAVRFRPFAVSLIVALTCGWILLAGPAGLMPLHLHLQTALDSSSFRLGIAAIAIAPLTVASLTSAWRRVHAEMAHVANFDELTGLYNRRAFSEQASGVIAAASPMRPMALLMLDIDRFKSINDTFSHFVGDSVIRQVGETLRGALRIGDLAGRIGGEEFAVLLPDCPPYVAKAIAERLRAEIAATQMPLEDGRTLGATVSIGVTSSVSALDTALRCADAALYIAKNGGRNRVALYSATDSVGADVPTAWWTASSA